MVLVAGASGATGREVVGQLLKLEQDVRVLVRPGAEIPGSWPEEKKLEIVQSSVSEMNMEEMMKVVEGCNAVISCLGHNPNLKGIFGKPRKLVTGAVKLICDTIHQMAPSRPMLFVLMNTSGNRFGDPDDSISPGEKVVTGILRKILPPHRDNEMAADYLRSQVGTENSFIEWVIVRPDALINHEMVTPYQVFPFPVRSPIFNPGKTSRINIAQFMAQIVTEKRYMEEWKGKMPVIYNQE